MKKLLHTVLVLLPMLLVAQIPQGINYQAVAYDANGFELANQEISIRLGILLETADAESSYSEAHQVTTNDFGLFSLLISQGNSTDDFSSLNWENGAFLKVELDTNLDGEYILMGVSSFNAVPYAKYSDSSPTDNRIDSLVSLFEYKFSLLSSPIQESLDMGASFTDLFSVGFQKDQFIGLNYQGGIVFYIDETGEHGLVAALEDIGQFEWGCYQEYVDGADGTSIGTGYQNTMDIVNQECLTENGGVTAAQAAFDAEINGYSDWYLPSRDELMRMYNTIGNGGPDGNIDGFASIYYWSSSESNNYSAWYVGFSNGYSDYFYKDTSRLVRIIRAF
jgi:hypothetical protein